MNKLNEYMEWGNEGIKEWRNEWMSEWMDGWMSEWMDECNQMEWNERKRGINKWMAGWMDGWTQPNGMKWKETRNK